MSDPRAAEPPPDALPQPGGPPLEIPPEGPPGEGGDGVIPTAGRLADHL